MREHRTPLLLILSCLGIHSSPSAPNITTSDVNSSVTNPPASQHLASTVQEVIPEDISFISAYLEPGGHDVRIFLLKHPKFTPRITCSFAVTNDSNASDITGFNATHDDRKLPWSFHPLVEYGGVYRGFVIFCTIPQEIRSHFSNATWYLLLRNELSSELSVLHIDPGRPAAGNSDLASPPFTVGLCVTPWFNTGTYKPEYITEWIELNRYLGANMIAFYLTEDLPISINLLLKSYQSESSNFTIHLIPWRLKVPNVSTTTWYRDQVLSHNDCLHRLAAMVDFVLFADLDELLIPQAMLRPENGTIAQWSHLLDHMQRAHPNQPSFCFPGRFFPPDSHPVDNGVSVFARRRATVNVYNDRQKCMVRTAEVEEVYVHWPSRPRSLIYARSFGVIFHYRICLRDGYKRCTPDTKYDQNVELAPYRSAVERQVQHRLTTSECCFPKQTPSDTSI